MSRLGPPRNAETNSRKPRSQKRDLGHPVQSRPMAVPASSSRVGSRQPSQVPASASTALRNQSLTRQPRPRLHSFRTLDRPPPRSHFETLHSPFKQRFIYGVINDTATSMEKENSHEKTAHFCSRNPGHHIHSGRLRRRSLSGNVETQYGKKQIHLRVRFP